jgi:hypothetical protein
MLYIGRGTLSTGEMGLTCVRHCFPSDDGYEDAGTLVAATAAAVRIGRTITHVSFSIGPAPLYL